MKKTLLLAATVLMVGGSALASNTGFKLNKPLVFAAGRSNLNWTSFPSFYYPNGQVGQPQTDQDMCVDFNGAPKVNSKVNSIVRFLGDQDLAKTKFCNNTISVFPVVPLEAYALSPAAASIVVDIVGSNDDAFAPNKAGASRYNLVFTSGRSNISWVSVPYHSKADTDQDLCVELNGAAKDNSKINSIIRFLGDQDLAKTKFCNNTISVFPLTPGEGYGFVPAGAGQSVAFNVY
jgi:hypothetical protein